MRVLVTGAAGTIGGAVSRALLTRGHQVLGVVQTDAEPVDPGVQALVADLTDPALVTSAAAGVDAAVHAASPNDERAGRFDHTVITALLDAFAGTDRPLVYTSG